MNSASSSDGPQLFRRKPKLQSSSSSNGDDLLLPLHSSRSRRPEMVPHNNVSNRFPILIGILLFGGVFLSTIIYFNSEAPTPSVNTIDGSEIPNADPVSDSSQPVPNPDNTNSGSNSDSNTAVTGDSNSETDTSTTATDSGSGSSSTGSTGSSDSNDNIQSSGSSGSSGSSTSDSSGSSGSSTSDSNPLSRPDPARIPYDPSKNYGDNPLIPAQISRFNSVKRALLWNWGNYANRTMGYDEMDPETGTGRNWSNDHDSQPLCLMPIESFDTLVVAGALDQLPAVKDAIRNQDFSEHRHPIVVFELTIRVLGGLLSGYTLDQDPLLLDQATQLAYHLSHSFSSFYEQQNFAQLAAEQNKTEKDIVLAYGGSFESLAQRRDEHLKKRSTMKDSTGALSPPEISLPQRLVEPAKNAASMSSYFPKVLLAEMGTLQIEWGYLSQITGSAVFDILAQSIFDWLIPLNEHNKNTNCNSFPCGFYPAFYEFRPWSGSKSSASGIEPHITNSRADLGSASDSFYEYLVKDYLMANDITKFDLYLQTVDTVLKRMTVTKTFCRYVSTLDDPLSPKADNKIENIKLHCKDITLLLGSHAGRQTYEFDHLECFVPGMLKYGSWIQKTRPWLKDKVSVWPDPNLVEETAHNLLEMCATLYLDSPLGLCPNTVNFHNTAGSTTKYRRSNMKPGMHDLNSEEITNLPKVFDLNNLRKSFFGYQLINQETPEYSIIYDHFHLRPEMVESLFYFTRLSKSEEEAQVFRDVSWQIFTSIETHTKRTYGYDAINGYSANKRPNLDNRTPSWWFAETLKYFLLTFSDSNHFSLEKYLLNTEAHFFPVYDIH